MTCDLYLLDIPRPGLRAVRFVFRRRSLKLLRDGLQHLEDAERDDLPALQGERDSGTSAAGQQGLRSPLKPRPADAGDPDAAGADAISH